MKTLTITLVIIIAALTSTVAARDITYIWESNLLSEYVAPSGIMAHDDWIWQNSATIVDPSGAYINVWHSGSADHHWLDDENGWATETDYALGYAGPLWDTGLNIDILVSYWGLEQQFDDSADMIFSLVKLSKSFQINKAQSITAYVKGANYTLTGGSSKDNGNIIVIGLGHSLKVNNLLTVNSELNAIEKWRVFGTEDNEIFTASTYLAWKIGEKVTVKLPSLALYFPNKKEDVKNEFVFGTGIVVNF